MTRNSGYILGYDPGGNDSHGVAIAEFDGQQCKSLAVTTVRDANEVLELIEAKLPLVSIGVDTLSSWGFGKSGWRSVDLWLRSTYPEVKRSVVSPNGLYGSMALNGMAVMRAVRRLHKEVVVSETHPKVLYWALSQQKYDYARNSALMDAQLSEWLGLQVITNNDHEWDAVASLLAALRGFTGDWGRDLFKETAELGCEMDFPAGVTNYWWPEV